MIEDVLFMAILSDSARMCWNVADSMSVFVPNSAIPGFYVNGRQSAKQEAHPNDENGMETKTMIPVSFCLCHHHHHPLNIQ